MLRATANRSSAWEGWLHALTCAALRDSGALDISELHNALVLTGWKGTEEDAARLFNTLDGAVDSDGATPLSRSLHTSRGTNACRLTVGQPHTL